MAETVWGRRPSVLQILLRDANRQNRNHRNVNRLPDSYPNLLWSLMKKKILWNLWNRRS
jgi:hypothetical protein